MSRLTPYLLSAPAVALLVGLLACPLVLLVRVSLFEPAHGRGFFVPATWTFANYSAITDRFGLQLLGFTITFGAGVAVLAVVLGFVLALFLRSLSSPWQQVALAGILLPKLASVLVILFGLQQLLGESGPIRWLSSLVGAGEVPIQLTRNLFGAVLGELLLILPYAVLMQFVQLGKIDPALLGAARGLGASSWQVFWRVTLPLSVPGLILTGQLGLVWGMGAFLGPLLLGGPEETTLSVEIHRQGFEYGRWPRAAAVAVLLVISVGASLASYSLLNLWGRRRT